MEIRSPTRNGNENVRVDLPRHHNPENVNPWNTQYAVQQMTLSICLSRGSYLTGFRQSTDVPCVHVCVPIRAPYIRCWIKFGFGLGGFCRVRVWKETRNDIYLARIFKFQKPPILVSPVLARFWTRNWAIGFPLVIFSKSRAI